MDAMQPTMQPSTFVAALPTQLEVFIDEHRDGLRASLEGLTEEQARRSLVPSRTTLLGLVKHATFVEKVWFDEAVTGRSRAEIGIPASPDESFVLDDADTVASVAALRFVLLHVLRELAQHCGHADILREQVLASEASRAKAGTPEAGQATVTGQAAGGEAAGGPG
jgi:hypothetical protein